MLWPALFIVVVWFLIWKSGVWTGDDLVSAYLGLGLIACILGIGAAFLFSNFMNKTWDEEVFPLAQLNEGNEGKVVYVYAKQEGGVYTYHYAKKTNLGPESAKEQLRQNVFLRQEKRQDAELKVSTLSYTSGWEWVFALHLPAVRYEFSIPEGSLGEK